VRERLAAIAGRPVSRETWDRLVAYGDMLQAGAKSQNLISASTLGNLWQRHILDSAQLLRFSQGANSTWVDVGSGAGLPGIVLAILSAGQVLLVEPRRLRADFLEGVIEELGLDNTAVAASKIERVVGKYDVITARAVAPLAKLLGITAHLAHRDTLWVLPKGRNAKSELAEAERSWHYDVRAEPSCTDADSSILLLSNVRAKAKS